MNATPSEIKILESFQIFEKKNLALFRGQPARHRYGYGHPWLARNAFLYGKIPGFSPDDSLRILWARITSVSKQLETSAVAVQLKDDFTRMRAFYLPASGVPVCLKVVANSGAIADRMRGELKLRTALESFGKINIPRIIAAHEEKDFLFYLEDMIIGRKLNICRDTDIFIQYGLPQIISLYKHFDLKNEPLSCHIPPDLATSLSSIIPGESVFLSSLQKALDENPQIPVSLCHGDLLPSNICVAKGKIYFLDWDRSFRGSIAHDMMRLLFKHPGKTGPLARAFSDILETEFNCQKPAINHQLTAYTAMRIVHTPRRANEFLGFWRRNLA